MVTKTMKEKLPPSIYQVNSKQVARATFGDGYSGSNLPFYALTGHNNTLVGGGGIPGLIYSLVILFVRSASAFFAYTSEKSHHAFARLAIGFLGVLTSLATVPVAIVYAALWAARALFTTLHALIQTLLEYLPLKLFALFKEGTAKLFDYAKNPNVNPVLRALAGLAGVFTAIGTGITAFFHFLMRSLLSPASAVREAFGVGYELGIRLFGKPGAAKALGALFAIGRFALSIGLIALLVFLAVPIALGAIIQVANAEMAMMPVTVSAVELLAKLPLAAQIQSWLGFQAVTAVVQPFVPVTAAAVAGISTWGVGAVTAAVGAVLVMDQIDAASKPENTAPAAAVVVDPQEPIQPNPMSTAKVTRLLDATQVAAQIVATRREEVVEAAAQAQSAAFSAAASRVPVASVGSSPSLFAKPSNPTPTPPSTEPPVQQAVAP